ncbi:MAG: hypothetical protein KDD01_17760 [Phaeodactylibacter sp.]|nr:hypothetical protein [Phaeodactylibacter sp.]
MDKEMMEGIKNLIEVIESLKSSQKARRVHNPKYNHNNSKRGRRWVYEVVCRNCKKIDRLKSHNALFCSDACKHDFFRKKQMAIGFTKQYCTSDMLNFLEEEVFNSLPLLEG